MKKLALDSTDIRILSAVQKHGQLSKTKLAEIVNLSPTASFLTRMKANVPANTRERYLLPDHVERIPIAAICYEPHVARNINTGRTGVRARCVDQPAAYGCHAFLPLDVRQILLWKVRNRRQYRIWRGLT